MNPHDELNFVVHVFCIRHLWLQQSKANLSLYLLSSLSSSNSSNHVHRECKETDSDRTNFLAILLQIICLLISTLILKFDRSVHGFWTHAVIRGNSSV